MRRLFCILAVLFLHLSSRGAEGRHDEMEVASYPVPAYLTEELEHFSISEILSDNGCSFTRTIADAKGQRIRRFWVKIDMPAPLSDDKDWILKLNKQLTNITAYIVHSNGKIDSQKSGWEIAPALRSVPHPDNVFALSLERNDSATIFLYIQTDLRWSSINDLGIWIAPREYWNNRRLRTYNFLSVYAGICMLATFYWLINFMLSRRINYIYLSLAVMSALLLCLDVYGITSALWDTEPLYSLVKYGQHYLWTPLLVVSHFAISYKANSFITHFRRSTIFWYWAACIITVAFLIIGPWLLHWNYAHNIAMGSILFCMVFGVIMISYLLSKKGFGSTGFALLAILPIFIGVGTYIFISFRLVSEKYLLALPIGALATVVMYFYGMVHYVRVLREKRYAEMLKNDALIRQQNILLEQTVEERTSELKETNDQLSRTLQDLRVTHSQLIEAERQKAIETLNALLKEQEVLFVSKMFDVQESERKRISTDLHDRLGSMLSTVKLYFSSVEEQVESLKKNAKEQYALAVTLLDEACEEVRKISHDLVSGELLRSGLVSALLQLARIIEGTGQLKVKVLAFGLETRLGRTTEIAIYHVAQELLNNVLKHAKASEVTIQMNRMDDTLNIILEDDGIGFDPAKVRPNQGLGINNIRSRIQQLNGTFTYDSTEGKGTTVIIDIPM